MSKHCPDCGATEDYRTHDCPGPDKLEEIRVLVEGARSWAAHGFDDGIGWREAKWMLDEIDFLRKGVRDADDMLEGLDRGILLEHVNNQLRELLEGHDT